MLSVAQLFARRQAKLEEKKKMIADLSTQILNNPEENVSLSALLLYNQISNMCGFVLL